MHILLHLPVVPLEVGGLGFFGICEHGSFPACLGGWSGRLCSASLSVRDAVSSRVFHLSCCSSPLSPSEQHADRRTRPVKTGLEVQAGQVVTRHLAHGSHLGAYVVLMVSLALASGKNAPCQARSLRLGGMSPKPLCSAWPTTPYCSSRVVKAGRRVSKIRHVAVDKYGARHVCASALD